MSYRLGNWTSLAAWLMWPAMLMLAIQPWSLLSTDCDCEPSIAAPAAALAQRSTCCCAQPPEAVSCCQRSTPTADPCGCDGPCGCRQRPDSAPLLPPFPAQTPGTDWVLLGLILAPAEWQPALLEATGQSGEPRWQVSPPRTAQQTCAWLSRFCC